MPFLLYECTQRPDGTRRYFQLKDVSLAGTTNGIIHPFVRRFAPKSGVFPWHAKVKDLLHEAGIPPSQRAVVADLKPAGDANVALYELTDVWGYCYREWTPIALRLETLFVRRSVPDPVRFKLRFSDEGCGRRLVHEFLYLQGGLQGGTWTWGPVGSVNGVLLKPEALEFFIAMLQESLARPGAGKPAAGDEGREGE